MLEVKQKAISTKEELANKTVNIFLNQHLFRLTGMWKWELQADGLFCSDVFVDPSDVPDVAGTYCLIHPADLTIVKDIIGRAKINIKEDFSFRVITSHGAVTIVNGFGLFEIFEEENFFQTIREKTFSDFVEEKELKKQHEGDALRLSAYQYAERIANNGIWFINITTHEAYYSDGIYHIHGLPAQSLNAHLNTFNSFIHPDDREAVTTTLERAYKVQAPVHLEYRLLLNETEIKYVTLSTRWSFNEKGEMIVSGIVKDITEKFTDEVQNLQLQKDLYLNQQMLLHAETMTRMANWHINLLTRKIVYSDHVYRIFGIKGNNLPLNTNMLLKFVHPEDKGLVEEANRKILYEHTAPDLEFRIIRPDGKTRYLKQKGKLIIDNKEMVMIGTILDITDTEIYEKKLHKAKIELELQQFSYAHAEEMAGTGSWIWNMSTGEIIWSNGFYELLGYKTGAIQLSQRVFQSVLHPEDKKAFSEHLVLMQEKGIESDFYFRIIRKNEVRFLQASFRNIQSDDKSVFIGTVQDKTTERVLEQQLSEQLNLAEMLSDASLDRVFVTDINNYVFKWNKCCEETYGIKREKVIGRSIFDVLPQLKDSEVLTYFQRVLKGETLYLKDQKEVVKAGYANLLMTPVKDQKENIIAVLTILHDMTKEYHLKQQLTNRLQFIEKLLEASVDRIIVLDKNMTYLYWNKKAEQYYGIKKQEVIGRNILELFPGFIDDPSFSEFRKVLKGEIVHIPAGKNLEDKKGYFETYLIPIKDERNDVTGVLWIVHDLVSEFHLAQHQRKANHILDSINEAYVEVDFNGKLRYINPKAEELWNVKKEELLGNNLLDVFPKAKDSETMAALIKALHEKVDGRGEFFAPVSNTWIYLSCTVTAEGVIMLFYDITEAKKAEEKLQEEHRRLKEAQAIGKLGSFEWNLESDEINWSDELYRINGMTLISQPLSIEKVMKLVHPDDMPGLQKLIEQATITPGFYKYVHRLINPDGTVKYVNQQFETLADSKGKVVRMHGSVQDITDEITSRQQLKESKDIQEAIFNASLHAIILFSAVRNKKGEIIDFKIVLNNEVSIQQSGKDLKGESYFKHFPQIKEHKIFDAYKKVVETGEPMDMEVFYDGDGLKNWFHITGVKLGDGLIGTSEDITDRKKSEENLTLVLRELGLQNKIYEHAEEIVKIGTWTWSHETGEASFSENMYVLFGIEPGEVAPDFTNILQYIHRDDRDGVLELIGHLKLGDEPKSASYKVIRKDGTERVFRNKAKMILTEKGEKVFVGTTQDITEEVELHNKLKERTQYAEAIIDASVNRIVVYDQQSNIIAWNKQSEEATGVSKKEALGRNLFQLFPKVKEDKLLLNAHKQALKGETVFLPAKPGLYTKSYYERYYIPLKNADGNVYAVLFMLHDVSNTIKQAEERDEFNKTLERKNKELEQKHEEIATFAFVSSHDLKEPLRKIDTFSDWLLLRETQNLSERGSKYLQRISSSVKRLNTLIDDIVILTEFHSDAKKTPGIDLNEILQSARADMADVIEGKNVRIESEPLPTIMANANQLFYLFKNLLDNSIKFGQKTRSPHVVVKSALVDSNTDRNVADGSNYYKISFEDNGIGFNILYKKKIFEVFQQLQDVKDSQSTGMGLAICKKVVENHGGFITAESEPGKGSVFCCYFPVE